MPRQEGVGPACEGSSARALGWSLTIGTPRKARVCYVASRGHPRTSSGVWQQASKPFSGEPAEAP